jgi:hypothetical protein
MTLIIQKPTGAKLNLRKNYIPLDASYSSVSLLLHGNGANGSTTITDSSPSPKTVTAVGNAQISTAIADPFGNSTRGVLAFDGSGDYLTAPDNDGFEFGSGNFTIESWIYATAGTNTFRCLIAKSSRSDGSGSGSFVLQISSANKLQMLFDSDAGILFDIDRQGTTTITLNSWHHMALTRSGTTFRGFLNGILEVSAVSSIALVNNAEVLTIGALGYLAGSFVSFFTGYIDELRITKGVARYTANFTPPTAPFPDF